MQSLSKLVTIILLSLIVARLSWVSLLTDWTLPNIQELADKYRTSQYCLIGLRDQFGLDNLVPEVKKMCGDGFAFTGNIDDPELYVLAGSSYITGESPAGINLELQPLTKYLFGLAGVLQLSPLVVQWAMLLLLLSILYLMGRSLGLPSALALVAPTILTFDGLVLEQLTRPYLDLTQSALITLGIYLLARSLTRLRSFWSFAIVLGLVALSKTFSMGVVLGMVGGVVVLLVAKERVLEYVRMLLLAVGVYLLGYSAFFVRHGIINLDFVNLHITILKFYKSYVPEYPLGEIWRLIFTGQWHTWWGDKGLVAVPEWSLLWPLGVFATLTLTWTTRLRHNPLILSIIIWTISYLLFASMRLVFPRYLLPILPTIYLVLVYYIGCLKSWFVSKRS